MVNHQPIRGTHWMDFASRVTRPGKREHKKRTGKIHHAIFMGQSSISTGPFSMSQVGFDSPLTSI